jgi:hypothetical protein
LALKADLFDKITVLFDNENQEGKEWHIKLAKIVSAVERASPSVPKARLKKAILNFRSIRPNAKIAANVLKFAPSALLSLRRNSLNPIIKKYRSF